MNSTKSKKKILKTDKHMMYCHNFLINMKEKKEKTTAGNYGTRKKKKKKRKKEMSQSDK